MLWRFLVLAVLALALAGAAACGDDDEDVNDDDGSATATAAPNGEQTDPPAETDEPTETSEPTDNETDDPTETGGGETTIELNAADFSFSTSTISAPAGSTVTIDFANVGSAPHTFTVDALDVDESLSGGESTSLSFTMPDSATEFYCAIHPTLMTGTLQPGDASAQSGSNDTGSDDEGGGDSPYIY